MLQNYIKVAFRNIRRNASYTIINVLGLGASVACAVLIFSIVTGHLSYESFHSNSDRIYRVVTEQHRDQVSYAESVPAPLGKAFREDYTFAEEVARVFSIEGVIGVEEEHKKFKDNAAFAEEAFFDIFNFPLKEGSVETALREPNTAIMTEKAARKYFGDQSPINKTFKLDNKVLFKVTGVLRAIPENTEFRSEIYLSYSTLKQYNEWIAGDSWGGIDGGFRCYVRLKQGATIAEVESVFPAYVKKHRAKSKNVHHYKLQPLREMHFDARYGGPMERKNLWILSMIAFFLLATACVNFVNLATAQATGRSKEVGVRKVLGGMRNQLFWQFITETGVITFFAMVAGLMAAYTLLPFVNSLFESEIRMNIIDSKLMIFMPALLVGVTLLAGIYPGLILSGFQPIESLKGRFNDVKVGGLNVRRSLIITQLAIAEILVIGLIVVICQMRYAKKADMGFDKDAILLVPVGSSDNKMTTLRSEFANIPGVTNISLCYGAPASNGDWNTTLRFDNRTEDEAFLVSCKAGDDHFISTFGLQLVAGRNLLASDTVREFLVNETVVKKLNLLPDDILGTQIAVNGGRFKGPVVGVIKDFHDRSFHDEINPIFVTTNNDLYNAYALKVKPGDINATLKTIGEKWSAAYPELIYESFFLDEQIADFYKTEDTMMKIIQAFSLVAILIGAVGLYGLVSFIANQKTKEIGIRKVLGSNIRQILWIFGKEFSILIIISFAIAAPLAGMMMSRWLKEFKYKVTLGAWIFFLALAATAVVCLCTVFLRSFQAARKNPVNALRSQ